MVLLRKSYTHLATRISSSMNVVSIQPALVPGISGNLTLRGGSVDDTSRPSSVLGEYCELRKERVRRLSPSKEDAARTCPRGNGTPTKKQIYLVAPKNKQALLLSFTGVVPRTTRSALFVKAQRLRGRRSGLLLNTPNRLHPCGASIHLTKPLLPPTAEPRVQHNPRWHRSLHVLGVRCVFDRACLHRPVFSGVKLLLTIDNSSHPSTSMLITYSPSVLPRCCLRSAPTPELPSVEGLPRS